MKKLMTLALLILTGIVVLPTAATATVNDPQVRVVVGQDRDHRRNRRNRDRRWNNRRHDNYGYVIRMEQRYIRIGRRVYREIYRSTYTRYGQLVRRQLIRRERLSRYDRYNDNDFRREGIRFGIHINF